MRKSFSSFMSFFDDNQKVGLALIIVGAINLIMALVNVVVAFTDEAANTGAVAVGAVGGIIFGILILMYGMNVRSGSNDKVGILSGLVRVIGIATILAAIFVAISAGLSDGSITTGIVSAIVEIIVGLILLWIASKIAGSNQNVISNVLWIILVIVFLVLAILAIVGFVTGLLEADLSSIVGAISSLCMFFVYAYAFLACLSPEVKSSMGI